MRTLTVWTVTYTPTEDGDRDVIREEEDVYTFQRVVWVNNSTDAVLGAETAVRQAVETIRRHYATFSNVSSDPYGARWAAADPYDSPITNTVEEVSCHLGDEWTPVERRAIVRMVEWHANR